MNTNSNKHAAPDVYAAGVLVELAKVDDATPQAWDVLHVRECTIRTSVDRAASLDVAF